MQIARYEIGGAEHYGLLEGDTLRRLPGGPFGDLTPSGQGDRLADATLLAPIKDPRVFAVGMNYIGHIKEAGAKTPNIPVLFMMPTTAVVGPGAAIVLPLEAKQVEHECELTIVIGRKARRISVEDALDCVLGYTCANDVSARDWQRNGGGGQWCRGKTFATFCPLGPSIVTTDEIPDPNKLTIRTVLNGEVMQDWNTDDMIFDVPAIIEFMSASMVLRPGTVILTGTPHGVGFARKPPVFMKAGDTVTIEIEKIGSLTNPVVEERV